MALKLLAVILLAFGATTVTKVTAAPLVSARCDLFMRGKASAGDGPNDDRDGRLDNQGLKEMRLSCSTVPPGEQVPISVNRTYITNLHTSLFKGVSVGPGDASCHRAIATAQTQIFGLVNFCGDYDLTFSSIDISGLHVHAPVTVGADDAIPWGLAVVLLGRQIRARVERARAQNNSVLSVFVTKDSASLRLEPGVIMSYNRGVWGSCVHALGSSSVVVHGSQMSHNFAHNSGGSITGRDQSHVLVTGGARISFCESRVWGGALQADGSANVTVAGGSVIHNNKAQYGGAAALKSAALVHIKGPGTTLHSNKAQLGGGGVAGQHYASILSTDGAIWRNNSGQSGGAAAGQNNVNITFDSNSLVTECHAQYGGVAAVADTGVIVFKGNTTLLRNRASWKGAGAYGGVAAAQGQSSILFYKSNVLGNTAGYGGVVALQNLCHMKAYAGSLFSGNVAESLGGVVCAMELSGVTFNGSRAINNSATGGTGGVVALEARTEAIITGSTVMANNSAVSGGAIALTTNSSVRLEGDSVLANNTASADGGAVYLAAGTALNVSLGDHVTTSSSSSSPEVAHTGGPRIYGNWAHLKGGGVMFAWQDAKVDNALRTIATGNNATFDVDISTPLQRIDTLSDAFVHLASMRNRTDTLTILVKLTGHLGVPSGGMRVQAMLRDSRAAGVLAAAESDVRGIATLKGVKLRVKPGYHTILISASDARNVQPAQVVVAVRTCIIGETTNELGDACESCAPGTFSLNPANYSCDSCPPDATCKGGAQIVPDVGHWSSSQFSPQVHPCPNTAACSGDRSVLLSCAVVPSVEYNNGSAAMWALRHGVGGAQNFAFKCMTNASAESSQRGNASRTPRGLLSINEATRYMTQAATREALCSKGYSGHVCGHCEEGYGQSGPFTCQPCLKRSTSVVLYVTAFIAALLMVRLLTWLTILDNNASAAAAAAASKAPTSAPPQPVSHKVRGSHAPTATLAGVSVRLGAWLKGLSQGLSDCCSSSSSTAAGSTILEEELPGPQQQQQTGSVQSAVPSGPGAALPQQHSSTGTGKSAATGPSNQAGGTSGSSSSSYLARASDIFRVLILYIQYMVIISNLRVPWPVSLSYPSKALTWLYSVGSSQALALECIYDVHAHDIPPDVQRQLVYIIMPLAVFMALWMLEVLLRCLRAVSPACAHGRCTVRKAARGRPAFHRLGTLTLVLFMVTIFFFLPALVRSGLTFFACIPLDNPNAVPYAWAGLAPGSYWVAGPNQPCWSGWHAKWAWCFGAPIIVLLCGIIPISIAALVFFNRHRLDSPELKRRFGFIYRQYRPNRAAWEAVVVFQTTILCVLAVFGLALGPHYQTLTMAAFCAMNIAMLLTFQPYKHRQQHRVQLFAFTCIFVMCFAALSFVPSFDGKVPPDAYKIACGAVVLTLNVLFIVWALWQLKLCLVVEFKGFWRGMSTKIAVMAGKARSFRGQGRGRLGPHGQAGYGKATSTTPVAPVAKAAAASAP